MQNIWKTSEMEAWRQDFSYKEYVELHKKRRELRISDGAILSESMYKDFCTMMENEHSRWIEANKDNV